MSETSPDPFAVGDDDPFAVDAPVDAADEVAAEPIPADTPDPNIPLVDGEGAVVKPPQQQQAEPPQQPVTDATPTPEPQAATPPPPAAPQEPQNTAAAPPAPTTEPEQPEPETAPAPAPPPPPQEPPAAPPATDEPESAAAAAPASPPPAQDDNGGAQADSGEVDLSKYRKYKILYATAAKQWTEIPLDNLPDGVRTTTDEEGNTFILARNADGARRIAWAIMGRPSSGVTVNPVPESSWKPKRLRPAPPRPERERLEIV